MDLSFAADGWLKKRTEIEIFMSPLSLRRRRLRRRGPYAGLAYGPALTTASTFKVEYSVASDFFPPRRRRALIGIQSD